MISPAVRKWALPSVMVVVIGGLIWFNLRRHDAWKKSNAYFELKAIQTDKGWGYDILMDGQRFIHQDVVPAISSGGYGFKTKEDALAVGKMVYDRVISGQLPMVTPKEVDSLGIVPDSAGKPRLKSDTSLKKH